MAQKRGFPLLFCEKKREKGGATALSGLFPIPAVFSEDVKSSGIAGLTSSMKSEGCESASFARFHILRIS